jgi:L-aspartate oxidase
MLRGASILVAGGGSGGLYAQTTNPHRIRGQVIGMAARAGAVIADPEFVQFHPTAMDVGEDPAPLATEALRGEGAILINKDGKRFMLDVHEDAELAPRDIVARAIFEQTQTGNRPMLDTTTAIGAEIGDMFPSVTQACLRNGIDPAVDPIPVAAAAHYHMGGIATDINGKASLDGLWVCGEASSTGLHGANRLASNGLLEALVYARICAEGIISTLAPAKDAPLIALTFGSGGTPPNAEAVQELRQTMTNCVGVVRDAMGLKTALRTIERLEQNHGDSLSFLNMCATATLIAAGALLREESRGAHERIDFPDTRADLAQSTQLTLVDAMAYRSKICGEPA